MRKTEWIAKKWFESAASMLRRTNQSLTDVLCQTLAGSASASLDARGHTLRNQLAVAPAAAHTTKRVDHTVYARLACHCSIHRYRRYKPVLT